MRSSRLVVFSLVITILIDAVGMGVVYPVFAPIFINDVSHIYSGVMSLDARNFWYEFVIAVYAIFMFLMSPILGSLSDRYGRKKILLLSLMGNALGFFIMGIALKFGSLWGIVLGRAIAGTTAGSLPIAQAAMMDISEDHEKPARLGLVVLGNVSGFVLGPAIGALFMDQAIWGAANYQAPFYAGGCIALLGLLLLLICFKETSQNLTDHAIHPLTGFVNIIKVFAAEKTGLLFVVFSLFMFAWGMFFSLIPVVLTERFLWDGSAVGYYITYIAFIFGVAVMVILPRLSKRFSIHKIVSISLLCLMVAAILYPLIHQIIWLWLLILIISAVPFAYVGVVTILSMQTEASKQGMLMGVVGSVFALAWGVAGPILNGYLLRYGLDVPFIAIAIMFAMAALLFVSASSMHKN